MIDTTGAEAAPRPLGLRWATFCIYYVYPMHALAFAGVGALLWGIGDAGSQGLGLAAWVLALLYLSGAAGLRNRTLLAWRLNWFLVAGMVLLNIVGAVLAFLADGPAEAVMPVLMAATMPLWFVWPSVVYWRKRRVLFSEYPESTLPVQWVGVPAAFAVVLVVVIAMAVLIPAIEDHRARSADAAPAPAPAPPTYVDFSNQPSAPAEPAAIAPAPPMDSWEADVAAFVRTRCELIVTSEAVRAEVDHNYRIFQAAINDVHRAEWSNREVLLAAGERVYAYPEYTPRGTCPQPAIVDPFARQGSTPAITHSPAPEPASEREQAPKAPGCEYQAVMTDEEIARCR